MILIIILIAFAIYHHFDFYTFFQFWMFISGFLYTQYLITYKADSWELYIWGIVVSLLLIITLFYRYNPDILLSASILNLRNYATIIPSFSNEIIHFADELNPIPYKYMKIYNFYDLGSEISVQQFLKSLQDNTAYIASLQFKSLNEDSPFIVLSNPILINNTSNPKLIADFILFRIFLMIDLYKLNENIENLSDDSNYTVVIKYEKLSHSVLF